MTTIDISTFIKRLDYLKEYLFCKIDGKVFVVNYNGVECCYQNVKEGIYLIPLRSTDNIGNGCGCGKTVKEI